MTPPGRVVSKRMLSDKLSDFDERWATTRSRPSSRGCARSSRAPARTIRTLRGLGYLVEAVDPPSS